MIHSASSSASSAPMRNAALAPTLGAADQNAALGPTDQIHIDKSETLHANLQRVPEIRPEVVERARTLATDPAYPSDAIIQQISAAILRSPDLSEDPS